MKLGIAEILENCSKLGSRNEKIEYLRKNDSQTLRAIFQGAFDPGIVWALPEGAPPYKPCEFFDQEGRLYQETRRLYLFLKDGNPNLTALKRESLFIALLESIAPADAKLLVEVKDKKMPFKGITVKLVQEAFPGLIPNHEQASTSEA